MAEHGSSQLVRVFIPDVKAQKCIVLNLMDTVWTGKQVILDKIYQELNLNPLNYGLYLPSIGPGKHGQFMNDSSLLMDYALEGNVPRLELRYKKRDYRQTMLNEKAILKANSKANQKKLLDHIASGAPKKIDKLLEAGLDPNFTTEDRNTPLGLACGRNSHTMCIRPLLSGGAHIDFRGKEGLTPMHRAAIGGNAQAINILLSFGASPNYRDAKGLTPLYHTAIMGDDIGVCISLLRYRAEIGIQDQGGWTELHHTAKYGHTQHADHLIRYGADINAKNLVGNTPLHVAASHGQIEFAILLLKRGADKMTPNYSGQTPSQVSILCGQHQLASHINAFSEDKIEKITLLPDYNSNAKIENKLYQVRRVSEICPIRPPNEELVGTLTEEWERPKNLQKYPVEPIDQPIVLEHPKMMAIRKNSPNISAKDSFMRVPDSGVGDTESVSSLEMGSNHSGSTGTPSQMTPNFRRPSFLQQRERLYRAGPGRYIALQDVESQQTGDLTLRMGMEIEVTYIGKGGYWEGKVDGKEGWFPRLAIKELGDDEFDYATLKKADSKTKVVVTKADSKTKVVAMELKDPVTQRADVSTSSSASNITTTSSNVTSSSASNITAGPSVREVKVVRGTRGYGFAMRGVRATKAMLFNPSPEVPALQYVGNVEAEGSAAEAGLKTGDFIVEVNGVDTTHSTHDEVVNIVRKSGGTLLMKIITPTIKPKSVSQQIKNQFTPINTPDILKKMEEESPITTHEPPNPEKVLDMASLKTATAGNGVAGGGSGSLTEQRETVIGSDKSPSIPRSGKFDWDSPGEESPAISRKTAAATGSPSLTHSISHEEEQPTSSIPKPPSSVLNYSSFNSVPFNSTKQASPSDRIRKSPIISPQFKASKDDLMKSKTLPASVKKKPPNYSEYMTASDHEEEDNEEENESTFAAALRESREKIRKSSLSKVQDRPRANTLGSSTPQPPQRSSPLITRHLAAGNIEEQEKLSPLQMQLLKASKERSERVSTSQSRLTTMQKNDRKEATERNSLADVLSRRLDSMSTKMKTPDHSDEDFDDSPKIVVSNKVSKNSEKKTEVNLVEQSKKAAPKGPPPSIKPKPVKKNEYEQSESLAVELTGSMSTVEPGTGSRSEDIPPPPWEVKLRPKKEQQRDPKTKNEVNIGVDWKSALKSSGGKSSPIVSAATGTEKVIATDSKIGNGGRKEKITPEYSREEEFTFTLPPPLPDTQTNRMSFGLDLEPPEAFMIEIKETDADDFPLPPPLGTPPLMDPPPPIASSKSGVAVSDDSPVPPPLPESSPPKLPASAEIFIFPETQRKGNQQPLDSALHSVPILEPKSNIIDLPKSVPTSTDTTAGLPRLVPTPDIPDLPSPIPSPVYVGPPRANFSTSPIPPPDFDEKGGFWIDDESPRLSNPPQDTSLSSPSQETEPCEIPPPVPSDPPPVPSDPPPLLDSDVSSEQITTDDVGPNQHEERVSSPSSEGSSVQNYNVTIESLPASNLASEKQKVDVVIASPSKVVPEVAKKPKKGFTSQLKEKAATIEPSPSLPKYNTTPLLEWSVDDVCSWLESIGLSEHISSFRENEMVGEHLSDLTKEDLRELGVKKLGHQKTFLSKISQIAEK